MHILGLSAYYHDSAACLLRNGEIVAAAQEERFTRKKHDQVFPANAIMYCLEEANLDPCELTNVVFYEKPFLKFERLLETYLAYAPFGFRSFTLSMSTWLKERLFQKSALIDGLRAILGDEVDWSERLVFSEHHLSHAASAFFPSPFSRSAVLTLDGVGEWTTTSIAIGNESDLEIVKEINFPHSLGLLYAAFTYYLGFKINSGEYKVMGLAPYGEPRFAQLIREHLIEIKTDGSFHLNMSYFNYCTGLTMTSKKFNQLFGDSPRSPETELTQKHMDIAASIQNITEEVLINLGRNIAKETQENNLCLAGGVALNCVANGVLLREKIFKNIWIQPAAGDAGGSIGAALALWHLKHGKPRKIMADMDSMNGSYLGPSFDDEDIEIILDNEGAIYHEVNEDELLILVANLLAEGKAVGWMQGRMEFGPRALGSRSILADPRSKHMQRQLNQKIKFRESFRPFAPSILREHASEWFELEIESPYMLFVSELRDSKRLHLTEFEDQLKGLEKLRVQRSDVAAVTHVDFSARVQTVNKATNPKFYRLLRSFYELTGCPMLVNTSFNVRGEPIVCTPKDAFRCFMGTDLDVLALGNYLIYKEEQAVSSNSNYKNRYDR